MNPFHYLARFLDKTDPTASLKHLAFAVVIGCSCLWLSWNLFVVEKITTEWNYAFGILMGAVTLGKVVGSSPAPAPTVGAVPSTVVEAKP